MVAPGGGLTQGVVLQGAYSDQMDAPSDEAGVDLMQWTKRESAEYRQQHYTVHTDRSIVLEAGDGCRVTMQPDGITLQVGGAVLHIGPDRLTSTVDIVARSLSAVQHVHSGVRIGNDNTQVPVR